MPWRLASRPSSGPARRDASSAFAALHGAQIALSVTEGQVCQPRAITVAGGDGGATLAIRG